MRICSQYVRKWNKADLIFVAGLWEITLKDQNTHQSSNLVETIIQRELRLELPRLPAWEYVVSRIIYVK